MHSKCQLWLCGTRKPFTLSGHERSLWSLIHLIRILIFILIPCFSPWLKWFKSQWIYSVFHELPSDWNPKHTVIIRLPLSGKKKFVIISQDLKNCSNYNCNCQLASEQHGFRPSSIIWAKKKCFKPTLK